MKNKDIERYYFEMFRRDYHLPQGEVEYGDKPDVIVRGERTTGIEIRNFFLQDGSRPESEQVQRKASEAVIKQAQKLYAEQERKKGFELTFSFNRLVPIVDQRNLAEKIASLATTLQDRNSGALWREEFRHIPELSFVYLNSREYPNPSWKLSQMYVGQFMSLDQLRKIVREKELKAREYRPCDAYWLLVVVDFMDRAQDQEISSESVVGLRSEIFEKIFIYKTCFGQIVEAP